MSRLVSLAHIKEAAKVVARSPHVRRTVLLEGFQLPTDVSKDVDLLLKLENTQNTGSFKIRGMVNLFASKDADTKKNGAVTMSAGNAGKSFSHLAKMEGIKSTVIMPNGVPKDRIDMIKSNGAQVEQTELSELQQAVDRYCAEEGRFYCHPFDAEELIAGHASCALEILEDCPDVDVLVVCCGGGGLVAGCAAAVKLTGSSAKVVAVEPEGAPSMFVSLQAGRPLSVAEARESLAGEGDLNASAHRGTKAHGLHAPYAGPISYEHVKVREPVFIGRMQVALTVSAKMGPIGVRG